MGKGPYRLGSRVHLPQTIKFFPSNHTWSPAFISIIFCMSFRCCRVSRSFCISCLVSCNFLMRLVEDRMSSRRNFTLAWGLNPSRSLCGECLIMSCLQELWANSAMGNCLAQSFCLPIVHTRRYCSTQAFIHSVWPSVLGWKAVDRFCETLSPAHKVLEKCDEKWGSRSDMILPGMPNQGMRCFKYSWATPGPLIVLWHGMNFATFEHP